MLIGGLEENVRDLVQGALVAHEEVTQSHTSGVRVA
jgi:hypothetical protein